jgi:magnesium chelatase family protein
MVRQRVARARDLQLERMRVEKLGGRLNATLSVSELERIAPLERDGKRLIEAAVERLGLSARGFLKVLRVARTIADLEGEATVRAPHIAEAIQGRLLDREVMR